MGVKTLMTQYEKKFGEPPPVHNHSIWPIIADVEKMLRRAIRRGSPITDKDYPKLEENTIY